MNIEQKKLGFTTSAISEKTSANANTTDLFMP